MQLAFIKQIKLIKQIKPPKTYQSVNQLDDGIRIDLTQTSKSKLGELYKNHKPTVHDTNKCNFLVNKQVDNSRYCGYTFEIHDRRTRTGRLVNRIYNITSDT